ncbi:MAG: hypothetical protein JXB34_02540 [Bacteroidales bacterium]|nr:hypothetical protein [Bacteroidales bacterium]
MKGLFHISMVFLIILCSFCNFAYSQSCFSFHNSKDCVPRLEKDFRIYGQSKSAYLVIDKKSDLTIVFYGNKDYIITVCTEKGYYPVHFVIKDFNTNSVLYDNMEDDYIESVGLTFDNPTKTTIEVTMLATEANPTDIGEDAACVGVHIQWRKAIKTGFRQ